MSRERSLARMTSCCAKDGRNPSDHLTTGDRHLPTGATKPREDPLFPLNSIIDSTRYASTNTRYHAQRQPFQLYNPINTYNRQHDQGRSITNQGPLQGQRRRLPRLHRRCKYLQEVEGRQKYSSRTLRRIIQGLCHSQVGFVVRITPHSVASSTQQNSAYRERWNNINIVITRPKTYRRSI